ncbi:hypothetical protein [Pontibacter vulgaris]|uniref:hypothetical protein n=1 Tax=Pontibacter vulgaris TaxID=2905679 RepID=UPI001FA730B8|nr:hypothetical protein [Pontibacter vulgaris]
MKQLRKLNYLFAALFVLVLLGCGDDEDKEPSRRDLLTSTTWQANHVFLDGVDVTSRVDLTQTSFKFEKNGNYTFKFDGNPIIGTWEFADNEQKLVLDKGTGDEENVKILLLSATNFNVQFEEVDDDTGINHTLEFRFINKP